MIIRMIKDVYFQPNTPDPVLDSKEVAVHT